MESVAVFFVKQKSAYELRISDCSSDVCSSDRPTRHLRHLDDRCPVGQLHLETGRCGSVLAVVEAEGHGGRAAGHRLLRLDIHVGTRHPCGGQLPCGVEGEHGKPTVHGPLFTSPALKFIMPPDPRVSSPHHPHPPLQY